jgi:hypothetical protein
MSLEFFIDINPSDRTMALGSTHPLTEIVPGEFHGGKCGRCIGLTTLPPSCAVVMKSGNLNFLEPSGPLQACNGTALPFYGGVMGFYEQRAKTVFSITAFVDQSKTILRA